MTKLPTSLKIAGHEYEVRVFDMLEETGDADMGNTHPAACRINVSSRAGESQQWATLLHEAIEGLNVEYAMHIEHDNIARLESAIFQLLEDNFPLWRYKVVKR